jgi:colanic acid biosynthesis glycosyl transferase WcaI
MRLLILSQNYEPEPIPKTSDLAKAFHKRGHSVSVITGFPNYPTGKLYPGYKLSLLKNKQFEGVNLTRTFVYPYHGKSAVGRIINYASFMLTAPLGLLTCGPVDVIYVWHPPLTIGIAAWIIARIRGVPFVYDVQDIWPEVLILSGMLKHGLFSDLLARLEKFVYRQADRIFTVTDGARENLIGKGALPEKVMVMPHWMDENLFESVDDTDVTELRQELGFDGKFVVLFAGNFGLVQGLDTVIKAAESLQENENILIMFVGDGVDKQRLVNLVDSKDLNQRVKFISRQPMERMPVFMAASDALLVHLKKSPISEYIIPTKTMAYLAAGKPIVMATEGASADIVQKSGAGLIVAPDQPLALADAIMELESLPEEERISMGRVGREYFLMNYSKSVVMQQYEDTLKEVAGL